MKKVALIAVVFIILTVFFSIVFQGKIILPQSFRLGPLSIHYYGIIMAVAVAAGCYLAIKRSPRFGIARQQTEDILFWTIIGGFLGARLYHVLTSAGYYYSHPIDILKVWNGGLSIYGAVLGGIVILIICNRFAPTTPPSDALGHPSLKRRGILQVLDWLAPSLLTGQIIGRFGNFFNYEVFGYPTNLPWKMFVPANFRPASFLSNNFFHPWFLYEALGNAIILIILLNVEKRRNLSPGGLFFSYLLLYNMLRLALEFIRIDSTFIGVFRLNTLVSLFLCLIAVTGLFFSNRKHVQIP